MHTASLQERYQIVFSIRSVPAADPAPLSAKARSAALLPAVSAEGGAAFANSFASLLGIDGPSGSTAAALPVPRLIEDATSGMILPDGNFPGNIGRVSAGTSAKIQPADTLPLEVTVETDIVSGTPGPLAAVPVLPTPVAETAVAPTIADDQPVPKAARHTLPQLASPAAARSDAAPGVPAAPLLLASADAALQAVAAKSRNPETASTMAAPPIAQLPKREELAQAGTIRHPAPSPMQIAVTPPSAVAVPEPVLTSAVPSAQAGPAAPDTMIQTPIAPRDFEALIDRLSQARDAAQPGTARLSLAHAEFGQVNLRFETGPGTPGAPSLPGNPGSVSVTMTSHDPDFALAARAALAERPASAPDPQRSDSAASGSGQQHGGAQTQHQTNGNARAPAHVPPREQAHDPAGAEQSGGVPPNARPPRHRGLYA